MVSRSQQVGSMKEVRHCKQVKHSYRESGLLCLSQGSQQQGKYPEQRHTLSIHWRLLQGYRLTDDIRMKVIQTEVSKDFHLLCQYHLTLPDSHPQKKNADVPFDNLLWFCFSLLSLPYPWTQASISLPPLTSTYALHTYTYTTHYTHKHTLHIYTHKEERHRHNCNINLLTE